MQWLEKAPENRDMETQIIKIDLKHLKKEEFALPAGILKAGGLVAFPTETVYGLGGDGMNPEAAEKIYAAKGRPSDNPLIIHIADPGDVDHIARDIPESARKLMEWFWPGPLTMIFHKKENVPLSTTGGLDTVAVRMPDHQAALMLIRESGVYIAAPSANTSGRPSPTRASHVIEDLSGKIEAVLDGGPVGIGLESTIIDMTEDTPVILRPGYITREMLSEAIGEVRMDEALLKKGTQIGIRPKAPGMKYKHYAPKAPLIIFEGCGRDVRKEIQERTLRARAEGKRVGIIAAGETKNCYSVNALIKSPGSRKDEDSIARGLYAVLREFDEEEVDIIFTESFRDGRLGPAVMNRLLKAAGYEVVEVSE